MPDLNPHEINKLSLNKSVHLRDAVDLPEMKTGALSFDYECASCSYRWSEKYPDGTMRMHEHASGEICPNCNTVQKVNLAQEDGYDQTLR